MADPKSRGKNIKLFDKIKIQHVSTGFRLHSLQHAWSSGSCNRAVGCHKAKDETDWFIVLKTDDQENTRSNLTYHFQYGDKILLSNVTAKKYLHATDEFPSQISKNFQVSLCDNGEGSLCCQEDHWEVLKSSTASDSYWRVGEEIKLKSEHFQSFLCSHARKLRESGDNQVFVRGKEQPQGTKKKTEAQIQAESIWVVTDIEPFIYSANLTDKNQIKKTEQAEQIYRLQKMKSQLNIKRVEFNTNASQDLLKIQNDRLAHLEIEKKKQEQNQKQQSFFSKIMRFCTPSE